MCPYFGFCDFAFVVNQNTIHHLHCIYLFVHHAVTVLKFGTIWKLYCKSLISSIELSKYYVQCAPSNMCCMPYFEIKHSLNIICVCVCMNSIVILFWHSMILHTLEMVRGAQHNWLTIKYYSIVAMLSPLKQREFITNYSISSFYLNGERGRTGIKVCNKIEHVVLRYVLCWISGNWDFFSPSKFQLLCDIILV